MAHGRLLADTHRAEKISKWQTFPIPAEGSKVTSVFLFHLSDRKQGSFPLSISYHSSVLDFFFFFLRSCLVVLHARRLPCASQKCFSRSTPSTTSSNVGPEFSVKERTISAKQGVFNHKDTLKKRSFRSVDENVTEDTRNLKSVFPLEKKKSL